MKTFTTAELAGHLNAELIGDGSVVLTGFTSPDLARAGDLTFAEKESYFAAADSSAASAILVSGPFASAGKVLLRVPNARVAAARVLLLFHPLAPAVPGIDPAARVAPGATIDPSAQIGPGCVIGEGASIGARTILSGGNHVGEDCRVGDDVRLFANVILYPRTRVGHRVAIHAGSVIGSDGYGYVFDQGRHLKMTQVGFVAIGDDVEIGANTAIDRGAFGATEIGEGTKIDNLVHVAHNVIIGRHCLIMGQVGFAGSTRLGDYCVIASQSGIAGHLTLGRKVTVGGKSGVTRDIPDGETVLGLPAAPDRQAKRQWIAVAKLPDLLHKVRELERRIEELSAAKD